MVVHCVYGLLGSMMSTMFSLFLLAYKLYAEVGDVIIDTQSEIATAYSLYAYKI